MAAFFYFKFFYFISSIHCVTNYFIVPGLGNSSEEHWQTYFKKAAANFHRIEQKDWDKPKSIFMV